MMKVAFLFDAAVSEEEAVRELKAHFAGKVVYHGHEVTPAHMRQLESHGGLVGVTAAPATTTTTAAAPAPQATTPVNLGVELDKDGMPWDEVIHAGTKTKTQAGTWTKKKGLDDAVRAAREAEIRAVMGAHSGAAPQTTTAVPGALPGSATIPVDTLNSMNNGGTPALTPEQVALLQQGATPAIAANTLPTLPGGPVMPSLPGMAAAAAAPTPEQLAYQNLVVFVAQHVQSAQNPQGRITETWVGDVIKAYGIVDAAGHGSLALLQHRPDVVQTVHQYIAQALGVAV